MTTRSGPHYSIYTTAAAHGAAGGVEFSIWTTLNFHRFIHKLYPLSFRVAYYRNMMPLPKLIAYFKNIARIKTVTTK